VSRVSGLDPGICGAGPGVIDVYRYVLVLPSRDNGDPGVFATLVDNWQVGDTIVVGSALRKYRILSIDPVADGDGLMSGVDAVWVVEPV
jgi:hypothetical protein